MTVAHYFTFLRLLLIPAFLAFYLHGLSWGIGPTQLPIILLFILIIQEASDAMDGYLARKLNQVTDFGKVVDPLADSLSRLTVYFCFTQGAPEISLWWPFLMLFRDSSVSTLRTLCALKGLALAARSTGKFKAFIQALSSFVILLMLYGFEKGDILLADLKFFSNLFAATASLFSLISGVDYIYANRSRVKKLLTI